MSYLDLLDAQLNALRGATTVDAVLAVAPNPSADVAGRDGFWGGDGDDLLGVLYDAGWSSYRYNAPYYWVVKDPAGNLLSYTEGDLSRGDNPLVGPVWA